MRIEKLRPIVKGLILHIPFVKSITDKGTGGTTESRYCYSVWMRHLKNWNSIRKDMPETVAELGPGDSLGIGLAALLSGCQSVVALDIIKYWDIKRNLKIFDELTLLFKQKASIPDNTEYPKVGPLLDNYDFPVNILSNETLKESLSEERISAIRKEIHEIDNPKNQFIKYNIPWHDDKIINKETIDFVYSQAVLEHVEDLEGTYAGIYKWLKKDGVMSHTIDFKSHGTSKSWNGYRTYSEFEWWIVEGGKAYVINRIPYSKNIELQKKYNFKIIKNVPVKMENKIPKRYFSKRFKDLSEEDMTTSSVYLLSIKE